MEIHETFTKKVLLKGVRVNLIKSSLDLDHVKSLYNNIISPGVLENLTIEIEDLEDFRKYITYTQNRWNLNQDFTFSIMNSKNKPLGQASIYNLSFLHYRGEIGIWLGRKHWNHGYAKESLKIIIKYAFLDLHLNRLQAHIFTQNKASIILFEKLGFIKEGLNEEYVKKENEKFNDVFVYALLFKNWIKNKK